MRFRNGNDDESISKIFAVSMQDLTYAFQHKASQLCNKKEFFNKTYQLYNKTMMGQHRT